MNAYLNNAVVLNGESQFATIAYKSGKTVNGPYLINLQTILKANHPNYTYFRIWDARIAYAMTETGLYNGWLKIIIQDGEQVTPLTIAQAKAARGYTCAAYLSGAYISLPLSYLDKWYSVASSDTGDVSMPEGVTKAPTFTVTVQDGSERTTPLQNAAMFKLIYRVAAAKDPPGSASTETGGGGVSAFSLDTVPEVVHSEFPDEEHLSARQLLKRKMEKAQEMLREEIAEGSTPATFGVLSVVDTAETSKTSVGIMGLEEAIAPTPNYNPYTYPYSYSAYDPSFSFYGDANQTYTFGRGITKPILSDLDIRERVKIDVDLGNHRPCVIHRLALGSLPMVMAGLAEYTTVHFRELFISITPKNIHRGGSHGCVTPYYCSDGPSESKVMWDRGVPAQSYRFIWNRYQPGPFTPFPYLYMDKPFTALQMLPFISLQFSSWSDAGEMNVFVDYKISLFGKRPVTSSSITPIADGGVTTYASS